MYFDIKMSKYDVTIAHVIHTEIVNFRIVPFFYINFKRAIQGEMKPEKNLQYLIYELRYDISIWINLYYKVK